MTSHDWQTIIDTLGDTMRLLILTALVLVWTAGYCVAGDKLDLASEQDKTSYSIGYQVGGDFKQQAVELRPDMLVKGIQDALASNEPQLTPEQMLTALTELKKQTEATQKGQ